MNFSDRVKDHPRISSYQPTSNDPLVLAVKDQLLVCTSATNPADPVHDALDDLGIGWRPITTLLSGIETNPKEDVEILEVTFRDGSNIFELTQNLRTHVVSHDPARVSPNHVLIPAPVEDHSCPWGPPQPTAKGDLAERPDAPPLRITVIDSGYQWFDVWGQNPLESYLEGLDFAEHIESAQGWVAGQQADEDVRKPDFDFIYALAGHANFIAGVIAQLCQQSLITIRNHNGMFRPAADDFATEAAVAHSLCKSTNAQLIDLGFAFACFGDTVSCTWGIAFRYLRAHANGAAPLVVCPVGNQRSSTRRYPAALHEVNPVMFRNVIAVGSTDPPGRPTIPLLVRLPFTNKMLRLGIDRRFSNYGDWVMCSADGNDVRSTFLMSTGKPVEDELPPYRVRGGSKPTFNFVNGWATWNGTSFAAPKVVANIGKLMVDDGSSATNAWTQLQDRAVRQTTRLGLEFPF